MSEATAFMISDMLVTAVQSGLSNGAKINGVILNKVKQKDISYDNFAYGIEHFIFGLSKKRYQEKKEEYQTLSTNMKR